MLKTISKNKKKNKITKKEKDIIEIIILTIIAYIFILGEVMTDNINNLDTMWTFGFCKKIAEGYIPYRDYNMVITPLFAQITAFFFKIFSPKMFVFNIVGAIETVILIVFQYLILKKMKISTKASIISIFLIIIYPFYFATNSYNILACMFLFILYYIEICKVRYEKYIKLTGKEEKNISILKLKIKYTVAYNILTGFILGLIFLSKQNIGVYAIIAITIYYFLKSILLKEITFKQSFIQLVVKAIFCIIPILIEVIYLYLNGALYNFIDYCFLGIGTFNEKIRSSLFSAFFNQDSIYEFMINVIIIAFVIIVPVFMYLRKKGKVIQKNNIDLNVLILSWLICIIGILYSIPLANEYHMYVTKYICLNMIIINILNINLIKKYIYKSISNISKIICIITPVICAIGLITIYSTVLYKSKLEAFKYTHIVEEEEQNILGVAGYVITYEKENNIPMYITTSNSTVFNIIRDKNEGIFELPLHGNMGNEDYNKAINQLKELEAKHDKFAVLIYTDDDNMFWQDAKEIPEYIRKNYTKDEEFLIFSTYVFERNVQ